MSEPSAEANFPCPEARRRLAFCEIAALPQVFEALLSSSEIPEAHKLVLSADAFQRWPAMDEASRTAVAASAAASGLDVFQNFLYHGVPAYGTASPTPERPPFDASLIYWAGFHFSPSDYDILRDGRYKETYASGVYPNIVAALDRKNRPLVRHLLSLGAELEYDDLSVHSDAPKRKAHAIEFVAKNYDAGIFEDLVDHGSPAVLARKCKHGQSLLNLLDGDERRGAVDLFRRLPRPELLALLDYRHDIFHRPTFLHALHAKGARADPHAMALLELYGDDAWPRDPGEAAMAFHQAVLCLSVPNLRKALSPERINAVCPKNRQALFYVLSEPDAEEKIRLLLDHGQDPFRNAGDSHWDHDWNPFEQMIDNAAYVRPRTYCHILLSHPAVDPFLPRRIFDETISLADYVEGRWPDMSDYFEDWKAMLQSRKDAAELEAMDLAASCPASPPRI